MESDKKQTPAATPESMPDTKAGQDIKDEVSKDIETAKSMAAEKFSAAKQAAKDKAEDVKQQATEKAHEKGDEATTQAGRQIEELSETIDAVASTLSDEDREGLASYARQMSTGMTQLAERLQNQSVDELASDVKKMARENPNGFLLGSIALGFGLSRFGKATVNREGDTGREANTGSQSESADYSGSHSTTASAAPTEQIYTGYTAGEQS